LPFQEVVRLNEKIALINARQWYPTQLAIEVSKRDGSKKMRLKYSGKGVCLVPELENGTEYLIDIYRTDLKGKILYKHLRRLVTPSEIPQKYIVLIGASVGSDWQINKLTERVPISSSFSFGFRVQYNFDKHEPINRLMNLPVPVYAIIIKECSAYFPRDIDNSMADIREWVGLIQSRGIVPVLATVVPVTHKHDKDHPGKFQSLLKFNNAIKTFAQENDIIIVDLEKTLRISAEDRHLKDEFAQEDGSHLIPRAYHVLDNMMVHVVKQLGEASL
jgi:hypothetical protein